MELHDLLRQLYDTATLLNILVARVLVMNASQTPVSRMAIVVRPLIANVIEHLQAIYDNLPKE